MSSINGIVLFLTTAAVSVSVTAWMQQQRSIRIVEKDYVQTLRNLFKPVKAPSRHTNDGKAWTTQELFELRKKFFSSLYCSSTISGSCKIIHVAGTKGKGSTIEYIASSLISEGKKVGIFTSPHIHTARERVKINRLLISQKDFTEYGKLAMDLLADKPWTVFFDLLLVIAIKYFEQEQVEFMILESGIGGRYDSTNFASKPAACIITSISLDHQNILGDTIEEIAAQKAGIIKPGSHIFTPSTQLSSVMKVFQKECALQKAILHEVNVNQDDLIHAGLSYETDVQMENACLALSVLNHMDINPGGWRNFYWPCRMERFRLRGTTVVLDGAHNGDSVRSFLRDLHMLYPQSEILVLFGAGQDKCLNDMIRELFSVALKVMMVQSKHFRALSEHELLSQVPTEHLGKIEPSQLEEFQASRLEQSKSAEEGTIGKRLRTLTNNRQSGVIVAVCGSLFAAAEAREILYQEEPILFSRTDWVREMDPPVSS
mmetsp:Transcript_27711/g.46553  ORF Transcript_27711/g.46553 Transcript_27711/m.46553 type:complete len:487 (-) Transcript_27711:1033-2493(-)